MSKINAVRMVNLSYNNNTMKVNDETLEMGGESTLLSLRNGGGKSVMVQMMMAPFVNARYRDLKDRKFENYFSTNTPTYILTEWILDNNSGFLLTGMGIKRRVTTSEQESKEELEIVTFVNEYKEGNAYDIHNFPITEKTQKGFKVKSFSNLRSKMDDIKSDKNYLFNYFEMSIDSQRRKYFEELKQYNINHREWESIIKKVNLKESGLSELFQEAKTISGLVEKWFLPTISDKLNDKEDKIKNSQEIIQKFIYQYKENENKIIRKQGIEEFKGYSLKILNAAEDFKTTKLNTETLKNDIANLYHHILCQITNLMQDKEELEQELARLYVELDEVEYERLSLEYHELNEKILSMKEDEQGIEKLINELGIKIDEHRQVIEIQECAKLYESYKELSRQVQIYENKLLIARSNDSEKISDRTNIGFTLKKIYEGIVDQQIKEVTLKSNEIQELEMSTSNLKNQSIHLETSYNQLNRESAALEEKVSAYNDKENSFNTRYGERLKRNIMGEYDEIIITSYNKDYDKRFNKTAQLLNEKATELVKNEEELIKSRAEQEEIKIKSAGLKTELEHKKKELIDLEVKIENIKKILIYSNIDDSKLYDKDYILKNLVRNIDTLKNEISGLTKELDQMEKAKKMYETGRNIKLSKETQERIASLDINLVFGLEWLKKQNLSTDKKKDLVSNNPFLPYSLIMSNSNLEKLKKEDGKVFTSFPVPIIEQEKLESTLEISIANNVYTVGNISFFISFNDKLLNEDELRTLIKELDASIDKLKNLIKTKEDEIGEFTKHKLKVEEFDAKKSDLKDLEQTLADIENKTITAQEKIIFIKDKLQSLETNIKDVEKIIKAAEGTSDSLQHEKQYFNELIVYYERYKNDKYNLYLKKEELIAIGKEKEAIRGKIEQEANLLDKLKDQARDMKTTLDKNEKNKRKYSGFETGEYLNKDIEDLEARYEAITAKLGAEVKELEDYLTNVRNSFVSIEGELLAKSNEYGLKEDVYKCVEYDTVKEKLFKDQKAEMEKQEKSKNKKLHLLQIEITKEDNQLSNKLADINKLEKEVPKEKIYITNLDFKTIKELKTREIDYCNKRIRVCNNTTESLKSSRDKMNDYAHFKRVEEVNFDITYEKVESTRNNFIKGYRESVKEEEEKEQALSICCNDLSTETRFTTDEFFKNTIDILSEIKSYPENVIKTLETVNEVHKKMLEQLETDLEKIEVEKKNIIEMLYEYIEQIHEHLGRIDDNSSININGRYVKMLEIIQPKWDEKEEYYRLQVKDFVETITQRCLKELYEGKNIEETISREITTNKLYDCVVGISEIDIKLYKIEASKQIRISWNQVSENSGGEGFLSAFVILSSLLSYMRKEENDIFKTSSEGKVLIMDNPFAQTNAEHLLKPLMDIAKKNNTQLICFTGLGGDSIYSRFDNIYVLNLIESKLKQGMQYLESEHKKGEDLVHMTSSRFRIQEELIEQMMLF